MPSYRALYIDTILERENVELEFSFDFRGFPAAWVPFLTVICDLISLQLTCFLPSRLTFQCLEEKHETELPKAKSNV